MMHLIKFAAKLDASPCTYTQYLFVENVTKKRDSDFSIKKLCNVIKSKNGEFFSQLCVHLM